MPSDPPDSRQIRMSAVVGGDGKAHRRVGTCTAGMIVTMNPPKLWPSVYHRAPPKTLFRRRSTSATIESARKFSR
ncbi:hypothetical protein A6A27_24660 [Micromonospora sp. CB01531]|nr:hypothetical protein A6A27_24660 [Micromonospora sp. CB01531]